MTESIHLGDKLVSEALSPLRQASARLVEGAIEDGLVALARPDLEAAFARGIEQAAKLANVKTDDIRRELDAEAFRTQLEKLENARAFALQAAKSQASTMSVQIADPDSVGDGKRRTCAEALMHVARKFVKDKPLAQALEALGAEMSTYQALLSQSGDKLDRSPIHAQTGRRKLLLLSFVGVALVFALGVAGSVFWSKKKVADAIARIDAAIAEEDPCAVTSIATDDRTYITAAQEARIKAKRAVCEENKAKAAYIASCEVLAKHFATQKLTPEDEAFAKDKAPRLLRAAKHELTTDDLFAKPSDMPCQDAPNKEQFFSIYALHAAVSPKAWTNATSVSEALRAALTAKDFVGETSYLSELDRRAEPLAAKAILSGKAKDLAEAETACTFRKSFGTAGGKCQGLLLLLEKQKKH